MLALIAILLAAILLVLLRMLATLRDIGKLLAIQVALHEEERQEKEEELEDASL